MNTDTNQVLTFHKWTLELRDRADFRPKQVDRVDIKISRTEIPLTSFNRFFYKAVGTDYRWGGREQWNDSDWDQFVHNKQLETWVLYVQGTPAGYSETEHADDGSARIHTFGLLSPFFGQGLGAHFLSFVVNRAFDLDATRVWLTTCTKDHAHALSNYQSRGFQIIHEEDVPFAR